MSNRGSVPGLFTGRDPTRQEKFKTLRVESGRVASVGSRRIGSRRVGSEGLQIPRVGLGHPYPIRPARRDATHEKPCSFPAWRVRINLRVSCLISQKSKLRKNQIVLYATIFCLYRVQSFLLPTNPHKLKTSYACTSASS